MARVSKMRTDTTSELVSGTLDKFGNSRDGEKRAVLVTLDRILIFSKVVHKQYNELTKKKEEQERKAKVKGGIHGPDVLRQSSPFAPGVTAAGRQ